MGWVGGLDGGWLDWVGRWWVDGWGIDGLGWVDGMVGGLGG